MPNYALGIFRICFAITSDYRFTQVCLGNKKVVSSIYLYLFAVRFLLTHPVKVEVQQKRQKIEAIKILEERVEKAEQELQSKDSLLRSETMVSKLWRNCIAARILQMNYRNEDLESLIKLGPEELLSKYEEVMVKVA
mgnify:FL=1